MSLFIFCVAKNTTEMLSLFKQPRMKLFAELLSKFESYSCRNQMATQILSSRIISDPSVIQRVSLK